MFRPNARMEFPNNGKSHRNDPKPFPNDPTEFPNDQKSRRNDRKSFPNDPTEHRNDRKPFPNDPTEHRNDPTERPLGSDGVPRRGKRRFNNPFS
jgi:hypothetical protein